MAGVLFLMLLMHAHTWPAPPSAKSSRSTMVMTIYYTPISCTASATLFGSCGSNGGGLRLVRTEQKRQPRVQWVPMTIIVAVAEPSSSSPPQHSPMLGHLAYSQTVVSFFYRMLRCIRLKRGRCVIPLGTFSLSQGGNGYAPRLSGPSEAAVGEMFSGKSRKAYRSSWPVVSLANLARKRSRKIFL